jgi:hypothetical protein
MAWVMIAFPKMARQTNSQALHFFSISVFGYIPVPPMAEPLGQWQKYELDCLGLQMQLRFSVFFRIGVRKAIVHEFGYESIVCV